MRARNKLVPKDQPFIKSDNWDAQERTNEYNTAMFPWIIFIIMLIIILGWIAGAMINYLADVLPIYRRFVAPECMQCQAKQSFLNYLIWPRRCIACGKRRGLRTWIVEGVAIVATVWMWAAPPYRLPFVLGYILLIYFGVVVVIDLEHRLILHPVSLVGVALGLVTGIWLHGLRSTLLGGLAGFGGMLGLYIFGIILVRLLSLLRGRGVADGEALGFGDVNLSGVLGLMLGWPGIVAGLFLAVMLGGVVSLLYMVVMIARRRYQAFSAIPYGPFLVAGAVILLYFRDGLITLIK